MTAQLSTKICSEFLASVKEFTEVGFAAEAEGTTANPFNLSVKYNRKYIIKGTYPELAIDFEKVVLSSGTLKQPENWEVTETEDGLQYTWDADPQMPWAESTDQVMMMAYFPIRNKVVYTLFGNNRLSGSDILEIPPSLRDTPMETYMSFVAADRKQTAHSIYTGSFNQ
ncbi:DUF6266 family protein [Pedobacter frigoris]|uniref:DUF6266 family protein n=1 Tax=Pedobacter frigoris TaxID=2571272 RepID=UPI00292D8BA5|nr:DUF6266 family protein [Pedobacter frigoris]